MNSTINKYILALDQGTTSSRSILYNLKDGSANIAQKSVKVRFPQDGWVEQDALDILNTQLETMKEVTSGIPAKEILAIGITNQRETIICWDRKTGKPLAPAIVWQCRRSSKLCDQLKKEGFADYIRENTGLVIDAYFSASKIRWLLEQDAALRTKVTKGEALFGTVDTWLVWNLTEGKSFVTEPSNASRTMLFDISNNQWDTSLYSWAGISEQNLAQVLPSKSNFGETKLLGSAIPITAILGDQQAALFGHGCFAQGSAKCTFGTGAFMLINSGSLRADNLQTGMLETVAWNLAQDDQTYALEGSVFIAGALFEWLAGPLGLIENPKESESGALEAGSSNGVFLVPAFVGLGAPYWDDRARGIIVGLTRDTSKGNILYAALESVAHSVADLIGENETDKLALMRIDGGMSKNSLFCQILADLTQTRVERNPDAEITAKGVAMLALCGIDATFSIEQSFELFHRALTADDIFEPKISFEELKQKRTNWQRAVERALNWV